MITNLLIISGAILGNMLLIFGLLLRPHNAVALRVGLLAYAIAAGAWLMRRVRAP
jgi:hypothetical protein